MPSSVINEATRRDWRELGFFYNIDDDARTWHLLGTHTGLLGFAQALHSYAALPANRQVSEHEHFGPYSYLKVGTCSKPEITGDWIAGPPEAIEALASRIEQVLEDGRTPATHQLRSWFAPESVYEFQLEVQASGFDPALADPACNGPGA